MKASRRVQPGSNRDLVGMLAEDILTKRLVDSGNGFVVGIDGKGCSGKSLLAHALMAELDDRGIACVIASIDDFCNPRAVRNEPDIPEALQVYHRNFDEHRWIENVIRPFRLEGRLRFDEVLLDPRFDRYCNHVQLELGAGGILIAEGLHLRKAAFRDLFSYSILLHISDETQLARALVRDARERDKTSEEVRHMYANRYVPSFRHYLRAARPCESVDIVIDYENPDHPVILSPQEATRIACADADLPEGDRRN